ncbi:hypothetical protein SEA_GAECEO_23 [Microbacterium phage GaeCeo]|nr:hypothetical protein SEA_GAECEO_23 [Microbacterium phage GaeCeo]
MPLEEPTAPAYGPDTFTDLATALATLYDNDEYLKGLIDAISSGVSQSEAACTVASGYAAFTGYQAPRVIKTGTEVTFIGGLLTCPATITAGAWITLCTVPTGFRPATDQAVTGVACLRYGTGSGQDFVSIRVTSAGLVQILPWDAYTSASYISLASGLSWKSA